MEIEDVEREMETQKQLAEQETTEDVEKKDTGSKEEEVPEQLLPPVVEGNHSDGVDRLIVPNYGGVDSPELWWS